MNKDTIPTTGRTAVFECKKCKEYYINTTSIEKSKQQGICKKCFNKKKKYHFTKLLKQDYKAKILFDTEFETKKRMLPNREAIFKCNNCFEPFIEDTYYATLNKKGECKQCQNILNKEIINQKDYDLKIISNLGYIRTSKKNGYNFISFQCPDCKKPFNMRSYKVKNKSITKCPSCYRLEHYKGNNRIKAIWAGMKTRSNPKMKQSSCYWSNYGSRKISRCTEWNDFNTFLKWALANKYSDELSIDRINNDGNYEPDNCRWTTQTIQAQNSRRKIGKAGYRGVKITKNTTGKLRFGAQISVNMKKKHLGTFNTAIEAALAYDNFVLDNNLAHLINFNK